MNKKLIIALACFGFAAGANAAVNFDQGVDVKSAVKEAVSSDVKLPEAKFGQLIGLTRDCKKITFGAADPLTSPEVALTSRETTQDCQNMGYPVGQICFPSTRYYNENVKVVITAPRELKPEQKEVFEVCLWGSFLSLKQVSPAYKYAVRQVLSTFELTPPAAVKSAAPADVCNLVMDGNTCVYKCKDGSYVSRPNPFPYIPAPNPWVGPISTPCAFSIPNPGPLITILK